MQGEFGLSNENSETQEEEEDLGVRDFGQVERILNAEENFEWVERIWDGWGEFGKAKRIGKRWEGFGNPEFMQVVSWL